MNNPFLLSPSGKDYLWGGQRLNEEYNKNINMNPLAEAWECSTHIDGPSFVNSGEYCGKSLIEVLKNKPELLGTKHKGESELSILIKLIDANKDLSVQVHPSDEYALKNEQSLGKSEMWYVLDAKPNAKLIYGLRKDYSKEQIKEAINNGIFTSCLQSIQVKKNDIFYIDSGIIHAIGEGCLIAEIQENSNITYRLYDYDRIGLDGKKRELHIDKALDVANLNGLIEPKQPLRLLEYKPGMASELLSRCKYFEVYRVLINTDSNNSIEYNTDNLSYKVLLCIEGEGKMLFDNGYIDFKKGNCIFIPANSRLNKIYGNCQMLEVRA